MALNRSSIFYEILNISKPWEIAILAYSKHRLRVEIKIDYGDSDLVCPICAYGAKVVDKTPVSWKYFKLFQYETHMTAYLPVIDAHNTDCRIHYDQHLLNNILLLDIMVVQLKNTPLLNPLHLLFSANGLAKPIVQ